MFHSKKLLVIPSLILCLLSVGIQTTQALTFTEVVNLLQAPDINLPTGVTNPKGNIGFILSNLFWGTADGTKNGKIKPQYLDYSGISAWTQSGTITYLTVSTGSVGIGTPDPGGYATAIRGTTDDNTAGALWVSGQTATTPGLMVRNDGNVGIGTASPAVKLDISGQMRVYGASSQITTTGTNGNDAQIYMVTDANTRGFYLDNDDANKLKFYTGYGKGVAGKEVTFDNEGNVGIGTVSPGANLQVNSPTGGAIRLQYTGNSGFARLTTDAANSLILGTVNSLSSVFIHDITGNVGIGTTANTGVKFYIKGSGNTSATYPFMVANSSGTNVLYVNDGGGGYLGAAAWTYLSDRRLKENITPLKYGIKEIMKLDTKKFDYIKGEKNNLGFIAQDVQFIFPELVTTQPSGMLGLKTDMIIPVLVNAIKEQQRQIERLTDEVKELKKR